MNAPSPLQPLGRAPRSGPSSWNLAIIIIVTLHVVFFAGLLQQGCRRPKNETAGASNLGLTPPQPTNAASADPFAGYAPPYAPPATPTPEPTNLAAYTPPAATTPAHAGDTSLPPVATTIPTSYWASATFQPTNLVTTPEPAPAPSTFTEHKIVPGDTPARIARKYGITLDQLREANPDMNDRRLQVNQILRIPAPSPRTPAAASLEAAATPGETVYEVKPGDTLTRIAARHGTTVQELRRYNNLRTDRILVKQQLKIPPKASPAIGAPQP